MITIGAAIFYARFSKNTNQIYKEQAIETVSSYVSSSYETKKNVFFFI